LKMNGVHAPEESPSDTNYVDLEEVVDRVPDHLEPWEVGCAIWSAAGGSEEGRRLFHNWASKLPKYNSSAVSVVWWQIHHSPPDHTGVEALVDLARQADPAWIGPSAKAHGADEPLGPEPPLAEPDGYDPSASGHHHERHAHNGHAAGDDGIRMPQDP